MDGLTLLLEAEMAGLTILADGDRLVIRGPKSADAVARRLLNHKAAVLVALSVCNGNTTPVKPEKDGGFVDSANDAEVVIRAEIVGDTLLLHCPTPELAAKIEAGRLRIEQALDEIVVETTRRERFISAIDEEEEADRLWDEATGPGLGCPVCGSLESWWDLRGRERCGVCEAATLDRARRFATKAARLRRQSPTTKPAPRAAPGRVSVAAVNTPDRNNQHPTQDNRRDLDRA
jgi:hypothetical protein